MLRSAILSLIILIPSIAVSQKAFNTYRHDLSNVYNLTISQYLIKSVEEKNELPDPLIVEEDFKFTDSLLTKIDGKTLVIVNSEHLLKLLKTKKEIILFRIFPLKYDGKYFTISFIPFRATYSKSKNNINLANGGGTTVFFSFENGAFSFVKLENYGI